MKLSAVINSKPQMLSIKPDLFYTALTQVNGTSTAERTLANKKGLRYIWKEISRGLDSLTKNTVAKSDTSVNEDFMVYTLSCNESNPTTVSLTFHKSRVKKKSLTLLCVRESMVLMGNTQ